MTVQSNSGAVVTGRFTVSTEIGNNLEIVTMFSNRATYPGTQDTGVYAIELRDSGSGEILRDGQANPTGTQTSQSTKLSNPTDRGNPTFGGQFIYRIVIPDASGQANTCQFWNTTTGRWQRGARIVGRVSNPNEILFIARLLLLL